MGTERREGEGGGYAYCSLKLKLLHKIFGEIAQYDLLCDNGYADFNVT